MPLFLVEVIFSDESFRYIEMTFEKAKHRLLVCLGEKLNEDFIEDFADAHDENELDFYCREHSDTFDSFGIYEINELTKNMELQKTIF